MTRMSCAVLALMALTVTALAPRAASADESGFYVGAGLGSARYPESPHLILGEVRLEGRLDERYADAWSFFAGYRFNPYLALEAGYVDLGEASVAMTDPSGATDSLVDVSFAVEGPTLALSGMLPLGNWDLHLKVGALFVDSQLEVAGSIDDTRIDLSIPGDSIDGFITIGAGYTIADRWHFALELTHFAENGESHTGQADILGLGGTVTWRF